MTKTTTAVLLTATLTTAATAGLAGFSSADWQSAGDNLLTVDANGNTWLDWTHTQGRSYNDVASQLGAGGEFEGFRYATEAEMTQLYANAGTPVVNPINTTDPGYAGALSLLSAVLGDTWADGGQTGAVYGLAGSSAVNPSLVGDFGVGPYHMVSAFSTDARGIVSLRFYNNGDDRILTEGHALVLIPAPGSAALLGLGGLMAARRRRN